MLLLPRWCEDEQDPCHMSPNHKTHEIRSDMWRFLLLLAEEAPTPRYEDGVQLVVVGKAKIGRLSSKAKLGPWR